MQESTRYDIISHWADTCETEMQLDNLKNAIETRFVLDDKSKDDLYQHIKQLKIQRSWVASKVAQRDYTQVERFPACDEFVDHKGAY